MSGVSEKWKNQMKGETKKMCHMFIFHMGGKSHTDQFLKIFFTLETKKAFLSGKKKNNPLDCHIYK